MPQSSAARLSLGFCFLFALKITALLGLCCCVGVNKSGVKGGRGQAVWYTQCKEPGGSGNCKRFTRRFYESHRCEGSAAVHYATSARVCVCVCLCVHLKDRQSMLHPRGRRQNAEEGGADVPCRSLLSVCAPLWSCQAHFLLKMNICCVWVLPLFQGLMNRRDVGLSNRHRIASRIMDNGGKKGGLGPGRNAWVHMLSRWQGDPALQNTIIFVKWGKFSLTPV